MKACQEHKEVKISLVTTKDMKICLKHVLHVYKKVEFTLFDVHLASVWERVMGCFAGGLLVEGRRKMS